MAKAHKHHHTVPVSYLLSFSTGTARRPRVNVLDLETGEWRSQSPRAVCKQSGFYRVDLPGLEENVVETDFLGQQEGAAAPLIRRITRDAIAYTRKGGRRLAVSPSEFGLVAAFVATMYLRSRSVRERSQRLANVAGHCMLADLVSDADRFESSIAAARADGIDLGNFSIEEARALSESADFTLDFERTFHVGAFVSTAPELAEIIMRKAPSLLVASEGTGLLITSDCPVSVYQKGDADDMSLYRADMRDPATGVLMPLTPEVAIRYDGELRPEVRTLSAREVAGINTATVFSGAKLAISATREFRWWNGSEFCEPDDLPIFSRRVKAELLQLEDAATRANAEKLMMSIRQQRGKSTSSSR